MTLRVFSVSLPTFAPSSSGEDCVSFWEEVYGDSFEDMPRDERHKLNHLLSYALRGFTLPIEGRTARQVWIQSVTQHSEELGDVDLESDLCCNVPKDGDELREFVVWLFLKVSIAIAHIPPPPSDLWPTPDESS